MLDNFLKSKQYKRKENLVKNPIKIVIIKTIEILNLNFQSWILNFNWSHMLPFPAGSCIKSFIEIWTNHCICY